MNPALLRERQTSLPLDHEIAVVKKAQYHSIWIIKRVPRKKDSFCQLKYSIFILKSKNHFFKGPFFLCILSIYLCPNKDFLFYKSLRFATAWCCNFELKSSIFVKSKNYKSPTKHYFNNRYSISMYSNNEKHEKRQKKKFCPKAVST